MTDEAAFILDFTGEELARLKAYHDGRSVNPNYAGPGPLDTLEVIRIDLMKMLAEAPSDQLSGKVWSDLLYLKEFAEWALVLARVKQNEVNRRRSWLYKLLYVVRHLGVE